MCETVIENDSPGKYGLLSLSHRGGLNSSAVCPPVCKMIVDKAVFLLLFFKAMGSHNKHDSKRVL